MPIGNWRESALRRLFQIQAADEADGLARRRRQAKYVERLVKKTQDGTMGRETDDMPDDGGVHIAGDTHNHVYNSDASGVAKAVTAGAVLLGGLGLGMGTAALLSGGDPPSVEQNDQDTDTVLGIELGPPLPGE